MCGFLPPQGSSKQFSETRTRRSTTWAAPPRWGFRGRHSKPTRISTRSGCIRASRNCWTPARGGRGKSFAYLDPATNTWKQNWVSDDGTIVRYEGTFEDGAMHFSGENLRADGSRKPARVTRDPMPDGRAHHPIEHSPDGGATWTSAFDAVYVMKPKEDAANGRVALRPATRRVT